MLARGCVVLLLLTMTVGNVAASCHLPVPKCQENDLLPVQDILGPRPMQGSTTASAEPVSAHVSATTDNTDKDGDGVHEGRSGSTGNVTFVVTLEPGANDTSVVIIMAEEPGITWTEGNYALRELSHAANATVTVQIPFRVGTAFQETHMDFDITSLGDVGSDYVSIEVEDGIKTLEASGTPWYAFRVPGWLFISGLVLVGVVVRIKS